MLFYLKFYKRGVDWTFLATNGLKSPRSIVGGGGGGGGGFIKSDQSYSMEYILLASLSLPDIFVAYYDGEMNQNPELWYIKKIIKKRSSSLD